MIERTVLESMDEAVTNLNRGHIDSDLAENSDRAQNKELRIGWQLPAHLFLEKTGESFCGQAGARETMSSKKVQACTSPIEYPLGYLRSENQVIGFANGICGNCIQSYYKSHSNVTSQNYLDIYSECILDNESDQKLGFCYTCGSPVEPNHCGTAHVADKYPVYICDECGIRTFTDIIESFGKVVDSNSSLDSLAQTLQYRLEKDLD